MLRGGAVELGLNSWWGLSQALGHFQKVYPSEVALSGTMQAFGDFVNLKEVLGASRCDAAVCCGCRDA